MKPQKKKIGEILLENKFIAKEILNEALKYHREYGVSLTQYLIAYGYITEEELAKAISEQFKLPYLPLKAYNIPDKIIKLIPADIAKRYCLIPVDNIKNILTVVMLDPLDTDAIKKIEKITGCMVQPFIGIFSDIIEAIRDYYQIDIHLPKEKKPKVAPFFIDTARYKGIDRRKSVRLKVKLDMHFPVQELYKKSRTKDLSLDGFLFESDNLLPVGSYVILQINLPKKYSESPIAAVVQVVRVIPLVNNKFDIGTKIIKILKEDANTIISYARSHVE